MATITVYILVLWQLAYIGPNHPPIIGPPAVPQAPAFMLEKDCELVKADYLRNRKTRKIAGAVCVPATIQQAK